MPFGSIARSIANLRRWRGETPLALVAGRVVVDVGAGGAVALSLIKSIQRGYSSFNIAANTASSISLGTTIVASKSVMILQFGSRYTGYTSRSLPVTHALTNTTIALTNTSSVTIQYRAEWQVVEFY